MDYTELKTKILNWSARDGDDAVTAEVDTFIEFATAMFNYGYGDYHPLRTREMEKTATLTESGGEYALPSDYLQYITIGESGKRPLGYASSSYSGYAYPDAQAGVPADFVISGSSLKIFPTASGDLTLTYYAKLDDLSDATPSNWLLAKQPQIYLHAALLHLSLFVKDNELFSRSAAMVRTLNDGLMTDEFASKYSRARVRPSMVTP